MLKSLITISLILIATLGWSQACPTSFSIAGNGLMTMSFASGTDRGTIVSLNMVDLSASPSPDTLLGVVGANTGPKNWKSSTTVGANFETSTNVKMHVIRGTAQGDTSFCTFSAGGALPIELMYFKGEIIDGNVKLIWATASEINNSHFTIERSTDNSNWEIVTVIGGAGSSVNKLEYEYTDYTPVNGTVYYRLRQDDFNGDYTYANTIAINNENNTKLNIMGLYVENNTLRVSLEGNTQDEPVTVRIYSLVGSVERTEVVDFNEFSNNMVNLDVSGLSGGVYTITVTQGNTQSTGKFIK